MKWKEKDPFRERTYRWFAWYPVECTDGHIHWLETVIRNVRWGADYGGMFKIYKHTAIRS